MVNTSGRELFLDAARGEATVRPPVWMMRQAGRYLPEYREIREEVDFVEAISTPAIAREISLQPWHRYRPDGVVMYSDILTALEPLGFEYHIESGVGPVIEDPIEAGDELERDHSPIDETLGFVGTLLEDLSDQLGAQAAVIGFVGGPFTLAAYAAEGRPASAYMQLRRLRYEFPDQFRQLLETIGDVLEEYVAYQADHGADVIQVFDTYAGLMTSPDYREFLLPVQRRVVEVASIPTIMYARNMGGRLDLLRDTGADVIGVDWTIDIEEAREALGTVPVQGNLDPAALYGRPADVRERTRTVAEGAGDAGHILNLGHGIHKATPPENVEAFFEAVRSIAR